MARKRLWTPDLSHGAGPIPCIEGALVVPPVPGAPQRMGIPAGVLRPDGSPVHEAITWQFRTAIHVPPTRPAPGEVSDLPGNWLFLGPLFSHFGHVLVEGIARLWALDRLGGRIDGVIYIPRFNVRPEEHADRVRPLLAAAGLHAPWRILTAPTRVERLHVPPQGLGLGRMIAGAPELRAFVRTQAGQGIAPQGAARIYITRSALPLTYQSVLAETTLEDLLAAEGYEVFRPERHSLTEQIAAYKAATHVIAPDGSALHLLALVGRERQKVGVIARRDGGYDLAFATQLRAFLGAEATAHYHLRRQWLVAGRRRGEPLTWGELDLPALGDSLRAAGLIEGAQPWPQPTDAEIEAQIRQIAAGKGCTLVPFPSRPRTATSRPSALRMSLRRLGRRFWPAQ